MTRTPGLPDNPHSHQAETHLDRLVEEDALVYWPAAAQAEALLAVAYELRTANLIAWHGLATEYGAREHDELTDGIKDRLGGLA